MCVCVCARARACVSVCVCECECVCVQIHIYRATKDERGHHRGAQISIFRFYAPQSGQPASYAVCPLLQPLCIQSMQQPTTRKKANLSKRYPPPQTYSIPLMLYHHRHHHHHIVYYMNISVSSGQEFASATERVRVNQCAAQGRSLRPRQSASATVSMLRRTVLTNCDCMAYCTSRTALRRKTRVYRR